MQVLKKFRLAFFCLFLSGCFSSGGVLDDGGTKEVNTDISDINITSSSNFRVGVLLPLTGPASQYGAGLRNASMLALEDIHNDNLILQYYDTQSTPSGARIAVNNAISQNSDLIIGPLMSSEVQAIATDTIYQGVPVIAFSTAQEVLQPTVYTLGLLVEEQVDRIMTFAAQKGRKNFALLIPDNGTGTAVAKAAVKSAKKNGVHVRVIGYYEPNTSDFGNIIKQMTDYQERHGRLARLKANLQYKANNGDMQAKQDLQKLATKEGLGDVGFDAVLIPEYGAKLTSAISMFAYFDVSYPDVQFLGTSIWENSRLNKESAIIGSWYPALSRSYSTYFSNKYTSIFGKKPSSLFSFAYDAVALANEVSKQDKENINKAITNPDGYSGINGPFRLFEDGTNQHSLDVIEVRSNGDVIIDAAPRMFADDGNSTRLEDIEIDDDFVSPLIYGKDVSTAQLQIFGKVLPAENQTLRVRDPDKEKEELSRLGIAE